LRAEFQLCKLMWALILNQRSCRFRAGIFSLWGQSQFLFLSDEIWRWQN
jgi:hypothetical protein